MEVSAFWEWPLTPLSFLGYGKQSCFLPSTGTGFHPSVVNGGQEILQEGKPNIRETPAHPNSWGKPCYQSDPIYLKEFI